MPIVHHIPVCPFSQRLEILLALKGLSERVEFRVVDITHPRDPELLAKTRGITALPVMELDAGDVLHLPGADGNMSHPAPVLRESLVILRYLEMRWPEAPPVSRRDALGHAVESLLAGHEGAFGNAGYAFVMNQDPARRTALHEALLREYARLNDLLEQWSPGSANKPWLFDRFGWAEVVFTPLFMRFWFLEYYEGFELPRAAAYARVSRWQEACREHPAAQQVCREEIVKLYHDYARGAGNGALLPGRTRSSFVFEPHWRTRPWPPRDKWGPAPSDSQLGLLRE
jgi:glutathione S-transferase